MQVTVVLGTAREGRASELVAHAVLSAFRERAGAVEVAYVDVREQLTEPRTVRRSDDERFFTEWAAVVQATDVFVFVLPEYNHGYPGEWKLLMDALSSEYVGKHAYVVGVSGGSFAGVRAADHARPVLVQYGLVVHKEGLFVGSARSQFTQTGDVADPQLAKRIEAFVDQVTGAG